MKYLVRWRCITCSEKRAARPIAYTTALFEACEDALHHIRFNITHHITLDMKREKEVKQR